MLEVSALSKSFAGLRAVHQVHFSVQEGAIVALIGPNGAGKTTCFNLVAGLIRADEGDVRFMGQPIIGLAPEEVCQAGIGRTFQVVRPFPDLTVVENVMVGALLRTHRTADARRQALELLDRLGLASKANWPAMRLTLPDRKLLETARALATRPRLLLLDEVMAGLRPTECDRIMDVLSALNHQGLTILLIEHVMRVVMRLANNVVVLHHGEKIAEGTPQQVSHNSQVLECYFGRKKAQ